MSQSIRIECDWFDQPVSLDPVERRTWAGVRVIIGASTVTRIWDRTANGPRSSIFIPAFPLANWLVQNWWALFHEPSSGPEAEDDISGLSRTGWLRRHSMRAAASDILLPNLHLFSDGRSMIANWERDNSDQYPQLPGFFLGYGRELIDATLAEENFRDFVRQVLDRLRDVDDQRASDLHFNWEAIDRADEAEVAFCRAAGRLGLDPFDAESWPKGLAELLEIEIPSRPTGNSIFSDLIETSPPESVIPAWEWVRIVRENFELGPISPAGLDGLDPLRKAVGVGYAAAEKARRLIGLDFDAPLEDIGSAAGRVGVGTFSFEFRNHIPSSGVRAEVGFSGSQGPIIVGPESRLESLRFLEARGMFQMAFGCANGPRLITDAHTWDQQASRAFAAELLAPRDGVRTVFQQRITANCSPDEAIDFAARHFQVQERLIENQLRNARVA